MRPALKAGLLPVWRNEDTLQLGIDDRRAVAVTGMAPARPLVGLLDGSRDQAQVVAEAAAHGIEAALASRVIDVLLAAGVVDDFPAGTVQALPDRQREQLTAELAAVSLARRDCDGGASALARRRSARILIRGPGPVGAILAGILTAAGVGTVSHPAGSPPGDRAGVGRRLPGASVERQRRRTGPAPRPDLIVLTGRQAPESIAGLLAGRAAHLTATAAEAIGVVGPLVLPGKSACLRCLEFTRADRDPAWPMILAQLMGREPAIPACGAALAAAVSAQAAGQVLLFLDRALETPAAVNGTLELVAPGWQWRRRTWPPHPACTCGASGAPHSPASQLPPGLITPPGRSPDQARP